MGLKIILDIVIPASKSVFALILTTSFVSSSDAFVGWQSMYISLPFTPAPFVGPSGLTNRLGPLGKTTAPKGVIILFIASKLLCDI